MPNMELMNEGKVQVLKLTRGGKANTITAGVIEEYHAVLEELERKEGNFSLLVTSDDPKYFCNGIDLEWLITKPPSYFPEFAALLDRLYLRFALVDFPVVGAINGHVYAGGAILAATFDFRFMREDRGFFCLPEVDIKIPFSPVMHEILRLYPNRQSMDELLLTGRRIGGREAAELQVVFRAFPEESFREKAREMAELLASKDRRTYGSIKRGIRQHLTDLQ